MLDVKDLRCFVAVYERRGFGRGAELLHTAPSNVSVRIRRLEDALGLPLFERRHRGIAPTEKAKELYEHASRVLAQLDELEHTVKTSRAA